VDVSKSTTIAKVTEKPRNIKRNFLLSQKIRARRKGSPVCPEKKRSFPGKNTAEKSFY